MSNSYRREIFFEFISFKSIFKFFIYLYKLLFYCSFLSNFYVKLDYVKFNDFKELWYFYFHEFNCTIKASFPCFYANNSSSNLLFSILIYSIFLFRFFNSTYNEVIFWSLVFILFPVVDSCYSIYFSCNIKRSDNYSIYFRFCFFKSYKPFFNDAFSFISFSKLFCSVKTSLQHF